MGVIPTMGAAAEAAGRELFRRSRDALFVAESSSRRIVDLNPAAEQLLGQHRDEALGRDLEEIAPVLRGCEETALDGGLVLLTVRPEQSLEEQELRHRLGSPLTSIIGFVELLLEREYPPERRRQLLQWVQTESERLAVMIRELRVRC